MMTENVAQFWCYKNMNLSEYKKSQEANIRDVRHPRTQK